MIDWLAKIDIATAVMLGVMFLGAWVLWRVQKDKNNNFDFEEMLRDDFGKPSAFRLAIFISLVSVYTQTHRFLWDHRLPLISQKSESDGGQHWQ